MGANFDFTIREYLMKNALLLCLISSVMLLTGCAGTAFVRVTDDQVALGKTTEAEVRQKLGAPYREGQVTLNGVQLKSLAYAYAAGLGEGAYPGVTPSRSQGFSFLDDKLVGYEFVSSWKEDSTDFDESKIASIKKGESTRADVIALLGAPTGKAIYPVVKEQGDEGMVYLYVHVKGSAFNMKVYNKSLLVTLDSKGVVKDTTYNSAGEK